MLKLIFFLPFLQEKDEILVAMSDVGISKNGHSSPVASEATTSSTTNSSNSPNSEVAKNSSSNSTLPNNAAVNVEVNRSAEYHKLIEYGLNEKVAARLEEIYKTGKNRIDEFSLALSKQSFGIEP